MPATIYLANGTTINCEEALESEKNIIVRNAQFNSLVQLSMRLWEQRAAASALVAMHVGVGPECIEMAHHSTWQRGMFNLVVPMLVKDKAAESTGTDKSLDKASNEVLLRIPMPAKLGEEQHPGSVADKLQCETASYIWMQRHCPEVRIPHLYGVGFPGANGGHFSHVSRLSIFRRVALYVRQLVASWLRRPVPSPYLPVAPPAESVPQPLAETGYMILEYLSEARFGKQLPYTVPHDQPLHDLYAQEPAKTRNLCRGFARIMLALARVPQPRIGAFRFCLADGTIRLDGRPVSCDMAILESEGAPRTVGLDTTYTSADRYVADLARFHESAFRAGPNAALDQADAEYQMAIMVVLRAVAHHFVGVRDGNGDRGGQPYLLHLSDSNPGNILVDDDWQVTAMFDLEWLFAAPVAELRAPLWLTWQDIHHITQDGYDDYCASRNIFMDVFREEEGKQTGTGETPLSDAMDASWTSQRTWYYASLSSVGGMTQIFQGRLKPLFWRTETKPDTDADTNSDTEPQKPALDLPYEALCRLWQPDAQTVVAQKLRDREQYMAGIERLFQDKE
ncbi:Aminoglycoside phosphotransferase [Niveomyces insectorum RCEF 264]|uniref:Aminoglycoside phosphotransferase n=1 Tax=Niveomyces insectorum RCEF 264 TaxID=1081102 RepID=A0A162K6A5_9HYPO|nr:Aminoglycoside phosphotransferase [Niveomyces insectorum RCEF 264]